MRLAGACQSAPSHRRTLTPSRPLRSALPPPAPQGFYNIVTQTEAERWEQTREEREERARQFRTSVVEQYRRRGLEPPSVLSSDKSEA